MKKIECRTGSPQQIKAQKTIGITIMTRKFASLLLAAGLLIGNAQAQQFGAGGNGVTSSTSYAFSGTGHPNGHVGLTAAQLAKIQAEASWGLSTIPLPNYLRHPQLGLAADQGLLVTQVIPGLSAEASGICLGAILISIDGQPINAGLPLPVLQVEHKVMILGETGVREVCIKPAVTARWNANNPLVQSMGPQANVYAQLLQNNPALLAATAANSSGPRSLAISHINGELSISAIVDGESGPVRIDLRGTQAQVMQQLANQPIAIQQQLTPHLGL